LGFAPNVFHAKPLSRKPQNNVCSRARGTALGGPGPTIFPVQRVAHGKRMGVHLPYRGVACEILMRHQHDTCLLISFDSSPGAYSPSNRYPTLSEAFLSKVTVYSHPVPILLCATRQSAKSAAVFLNSFKARHTLSTLWI